MTRRKPKHQDFRMVHKLVRKTAMEMAEAFYEFAAHDNLFYKMYPSIVFFRDYEWPRFVRVAKETLTTMLTGSYPDTYKTQIYEALLLDSTLPYSQQEEQIVNIPH